MSKTIYRDPYSQEVVVCRVPLTLVILEHLHVLLVALGDARELLHSSVNALQEGVLEGRHEVGRAGEEKSTNKRKRKTQNAKSKGKSKRESKKQKKYQ